MIDEGKFLVDQSVHLSTRHKNKQSTFSRVTTSEAFTSEHITTHIDPFNL